jgi:hypothetical protein
MRLTQTATRENHEERTPSCFSLSFAPILHVVLLIFRVG